MTKKDYIAIAAIVRSEVEREWPRGAEVFYPLAQSLADFLASDNPRFNRDTFMKACNL